MVQGDRLSPARWDELEQVQALARAKQELMDEAPAQTLLFAE